MTPSNTHSQHLFGKAIAASFMRVLLGAGLFAAGAAQAHYLWIEPGDTGARLYYGEADTLLKEKSPGLLDNIKAPQGSVRTSSGKSGEAIIQRNTEYFAIANGKDASAILVAEESAEVKDLSKYGYGIAKSNYYARHGKADGGSSLALDLQERAPNTFAVLYRGQPLKDAKLEVIAPNTWVQEHKTDAQGLVEINAPWRGHYLIHLLHVDATPGEFGGKKYDALRNHFTYSFIKHDGMDPGPAVPPKHGVD